MVDGCIQCPYHGWQYDGSGNCTKMPSTAFCRGITVSTLPVAEAEGFVWVWPGRSVPEHSVPQHVTRPPHGFTVSRTLTRSFLRIVRVGLSKQTLSLTVLHHINKAVASALC